MSVQQDTTRNETGSPNIPDDALFDTMAAAVYTDLSASTMNKKRLDGSGPPFYKIGRCVRYRKSDLDTWLGRCRVNSTTEADAAVRKKIRGQKP